MRTRRMVRAGRRRAWTEQATRDRRPATGARQYRIRSDCGIAWRPLPVAGRWSPAPSTPLAPPQLPPRAPLPDRQRAADIRAGGGIGEDAGLVGGAAGLELRAVAVEEVGLGRGAGLPAAEAAAQDVAVEGLDGGLAGLRIAGRAHAGDLDDVA